MADPKPYKRGYSFGNWRADVPDRPLPGVNLDIELDKIAGASDELTARVNAGIDVSINNEAAAAGGAALSEMPCRVAAPRIAEINRQIAAQTPPEGSEAP